MFPHAFPFDPTYGRTREQLLAIRAPAEPADFVSFWQRTYAEARAVPLALELRPSATALPDRLVFDVAFTSLGGFRLGGWLTVPRDRPPTRGFVVNHGYGGRDAPDAWLPDDTAAAIFPCARGLSRSARPDIGAVAALHVLHGIAHRETYIHRGCVADVWAALRALQEHFPSLTRFDYIGSSFGGGIGALAAPWEPAFARVFLGVPSFGHHPFRLSVPCVGSGEAVRLRAQRDPSIADVLRYFDASIAARHLAKPTLVECALFDPAVPPPGQFAVYNALPGPKELIVIPASHFEYPAAVAVEQSTHARMTAFFAG